MAAKQNQAFTIRFCKKKLNQTRKAIAEFVSKIEGKRLLLILDNFEQLSPYAPVLGRILEGTSQLKILTTSREPLGIKGEWRYPVGGLDPEESAINLFRERAMQVKPDFSYGINAKGMSRICDLVDGLPLALEMAASWTRLLS